MPISNDEFRHALSRFASGVTIITTRDAAGRDHGMTVSAFASLSLSPPLVMVAIAHDATMAPVIGDARSFAVNVLAESQEPLSRRFADKLDDRFDGIALHRGSLGDALIDGTLTGLQCMIMQRIDAGDHTIYIGEVHEAETRDGTPLLYFRGGYAGLGQ